MKVATKNKFFHELKKIYSDVDFIPKNYISQAFDNATIEIQNKEKQDKSKNIKEAFNMKIKKKEINKYISFEKINVGDCFYYPHDTDTLFMKVCVEGKYMPVNLKSGIITSLRDVEQVVLVSNAKITYTVGE